MKTAGRLFLIVFWTIIWGVVVVPFLIFDLIFWKCRDEVRRLVGEWLEEVDMEDNADD